MMGGRIRGTLPGGGPQTSSRMKLRRGGRPPQRQCRDSGEGGQTPPRARLFFEYGILPYTSVIHLPKWDLICEMEQVGCADKGLTMRDTNATHANLKTTFLPRPYDIVLPPLPPQSIHSS